MNEIRVFPPKGYYEPFTFDKRHVAEGDFVHKGDVLFVLYSSNGEQVPLTSPCSGNIALVADTSKGTFQSDQPVVWIEEAASNRQPEPLPPLNTVRDSSNRFQLSFSLEHSSGTASRADVATPTGAKPLELADDFERKPTAVASNTEVAELEQDFVELLNSESLFEAAARKDFIETRNYVASELQKRGHKYFPVVEKVKDARLEQKYFEVQREAKHVHAGHPATNISKRASKRLPSKPKTNRSGPSKELFREKKLRQPRQSDQIRRKGGFGGLLLAFLCLPVLAGAVSLTAESIGLVFDGLRGGVALGSGIIITAFCLLLSDPIRAATGQVFAMALLAGAVVAFLHQNPGLNWSSIAGISSLPVFGGKQGPITTELGLPSIASFSNGEVPRPTAAQQAEFERFILQ
ncbi:hypothetical protein [Aestuariivita boseongensis]|uniref:hypothetical protein n=1 Tax=Aestuariivita boseongensis TaxID=1470562 RepID=UPI0012F77538|nr:hypothetical protein [Aestuariivita boseongensis]